MSVAMCRPLAAEEYRIQPVDEVSPPWWNLGHTSWFFVRNILQQFGGEHDPRDEEYDYLLNSYYASLGERLPRGARGQITRPTTDEIYDYRESVDRRVLELIEQVAESSFEALAATLRIGLEHEQQHQELFYTEIKYILGQNPPLLRRAYDGLTEQLPATGVASEFVSFEGGLYNFGNLESDWCWDNELPVHRQFLAPFALSTALVTNAEYLEFIADGGYRNQLLWLDNGWRQRSEQNWQAPLYWERSDGQWQQFTLHGMQPLDPQQPASHVSFYEADAFARWRSENFASHRGVRLATEREWEHAARLGPDDISSLHDLHCVLWQWTASYYEPYPGYQPFPGVLAEYNGKFMDNQRVLRGGSFATPAGHYRLSYRNFWSAETRFQFTGIRLARHLE
jgi:ergothioneine biosynthesis protein EgtB